MSKQNNNTSYEKMLQELLKKFSFYEYINVTKLIRLDFNNDEEITITSDGRLIKGNDNSRILGYVNHTEQIVAISELSDPPKFKHYDFSKLIDFEDLTDECKRNLEKMYFKSVL